MYAFTVKICLNPFELDFIFCIEFSTENHRVLKGSIESYYLRDEGVATVCDCIYGDELQMSPFCLLPQLRRHQGLRFRVEILRPCCLCMILNWSYYLAGPTLYFSCVSPWDAIILRLGDEPKGVDEEGAGDGEGHGEDMATSIAEGEDGVRADDDDYAKGTLRYDYEPISNSPA